MMSPLTCLSTATVNSPSSISEEGVVILDLAGDCRPKPYQVLAVFPSISFQDNMQDLNTAINTKHSHGSNEGRGRGFYGFALHEQDLAYSFMDSQSGRITAFRIHEVFNTLNHQDASLRGLIILQNVFGKG